MFIDIFLFLPGRAHPLMELYYRFVVLLVETSLILGVIIVGFIFKKTAYNKLYRFVEDLEESIDPDFSLYTFLLEGYTQALLISRVLACLHTIFIVYLILLLVLGVVVTSIL